MIIASNVELDLIVYMNWVVSMRNVQFVLDNSSLADVHVITLA